MSMQKTIQKAQSAGYSSLNTTEKVGFELYCLGKSVMPSERKLVRFSATTIMMITWGALVVLWSLGKLERTGLVIPMTALAFLILGRLWNIEMKELLE